MILLGSVVNEVQALNIDSPFVTFANVMLLGSVVNEVQSLNIASPLVIVFNHSP